MCCEVKTQSVYRPWELILAKSPKLEGLLLSVIVLEYVPFFSHWLLLHQKSHGILSFVFLGKFPIR